MAVTALRSSNPRAVQIRASGNQVLPCRLVFTDRLGTYEAPGCRERGAHLRTSVDFDLNHRPAGLALRALQCCPGLYVLEKWSALGDDFRTFLVADRTQTTTLATIYSP